MPTYLILELTKRAFGEISAKLRELGYDQAAVVEQDGRPVIRLNGVAVSPTRTEEYETTLWARSIFGAATRQGLVEIEIKGAEVTCSPTEARAFAYSLLEAAEAAETDELVVSWLRAAVGADDHAAAQVLLDFREAREAKRKK
jgi:hypothetical protein